MDCISFGYVFCVVVFEGEGTLFSILICWKRLPHPPAPSRVARLKKWRTFRSLLVSVQYISRMAGLMSVDFSEELLYGSSSMQELVALRLVV